MNEPTIDEQIEWLRSDVKAHENYGHILASLERLKLLDAQGPKDSQPVPMEPNCIRTMRDDSTITYHDALILDYIDTLQSELKRVTEERDAHYNRLAGLLFSGALDELTNTDVQQYAKDYIDQKSLNKRMVELLRGMRDTVFYLADYNTLMETERKLVDDVSKLLKDEVK